MLSSMQQQRKIKITLSDYPYQQDIEHRIQMAQLSVFEVHVLKEIIHHSLTISIEAFASELEIDIKALIPVLDKLSATKLFYRKNMMLYVDKDKRRYFEFQLEKFDDDFKPDLEFLQNVLNQVPIPILPLWYAIPRSSNNIFASIIEKYFSTPKIYRQYLNELEFDNPILNAIIKDVYQAPPFKVKASELIAKYQLTRECFEEYLLLLEYHFACCLSYNQVDGFWQEVVTPFAELLEYMQFEARTKAIPISNPIQKTFHINFNFIQALADLLQLCQNKKISFKEKTNVKNNVFLQGQRYILDKLLQLEFVKQSSKGLFTATEKGKNWLSKSLPEKISSLAVDPLNTVSHLNHFAHLWNVRNLHLVEKKLRMLIPNEWVEFDQYLEGFIAPLGDKEPVTLKNKGKKWKYVLPTYTLQEKQFIQAVIMERLAELGVVNTGMYKEKACFCLTPFGQQFIS